MSRSTIPTGSLKSVPITGSRHRHGPPDPSWHRLAHDVCEFDVTSGPACAPSRPSCRAGPSRSSLALPQQWPLGPIPSAPVPCMPGTNVTVDAAAHRLDLPPGCYGRLRVNSERVLNLSAGRLLLHRRGALAEQVDRERRRRNGECRTGEAGRSLLA